MCVFACVVVIQKTKPSVSCSNRNTEHNRLCAISCLTSLTMAHACEATDAAAQPVIRREGPQRRAIPLTITETHLDAVHGHALASLCVFVH